MDRKICWKYFATINWTIKNKNGRNKAEIYVNNSVFFFFRNNRFLKKHLVVTSLMIYEPLLLFFPSCAHKMFFVRKKLIWIGEPSDTPGRKCLVSDPFKLQAPVYLEQPVRFFLFLKKFHIFCPDKIYFGYLGHEWTVFLTNISFSLFYSTN